MRIAPTALALAAALTLVAAATAGAATTSMSAAHSHAAGTAAYQPQKWVVSGFVGFGDAGYFGNGSTMFGAMAEYGLNDKISLGGRVGHSSSDYSDGFGDTWKYSYNILAARGAYHFGDQLNVENLDAYAGVELGYNHVSVTTPANLYYSGYSAGASATRAGVFGGGRYWFSPKFAGFGEVGFGLGNLTLGASLRF
jgi:hypothetical protein